MAERIGVCARCRTRFKVPGTFLGDRAKCKKCGGIVSVGAEIAGGNAAKPGKAVAGPPRSAPTPIRSAAEKPLDAPRIAPTAPSRSSTPTAPPVAKSSSRNLTPPTPRPETSKQIDTTERSQPQTTRAIGAFDGPRAAGAKASDARFLLGAAAIAICMIGAIGYWMVYGAEGEYGSEAGTSRTLVAQAAADPNLARSGPRATPESTKGSAEASVSTAAVDPPEAAPARQPPSPFLRLRPIPHPAGCTPALWESLQAPAKIVTGPKANREARKDALEVLRREPLAGISTLLDAMNGLDISKSEGFDICSRAIRGIDAVSYGAVRAPFKFEANQRLENLEFNVAAITTLASTWTAALAKPDAIVERIHDAMNAGAMAADDF